MNELPENEAVQSTRGFNCIFIHSILDDAGLTPQQFRLLAHISRRAGDGKSWASNKTMAEVCKMHEETVVSALAELERRKMVERISRPGKTTLWKVTPPEKWDIQNIPGTGLAGRIPATPRNQYPPETNPPHPPETNPPHPPETNPPEGNQSKVIQGRKSKKAQAPLPPLPENLRVGELPKAWDDWVAHRNEIKFPLTARACEMEFSNFEKWGIEKSVQSINNAIRCRYRGLFEPRENSKQFGKQTEKPDYSKGWA